MSRGTPDPDPDAERAFLDAYDPTQFERPSVAVDAVVLSVDPEGRGGQGALRVLLVERRVHPFLGAHALPGGFVGIREPLDAAVHRVLHDKAGITPDHLEQLYTFGELDRDPRLRVITVAWLGVARPERFTRLPDGVVAAEVIVDWPGETGGPASALGPDGRPLALGFDHPTILGTAVQRVRGKLAWTDLAFAFLPERFTLRQLRQVWETLLGRPLNKDSFRRTVLARHPLTDTGELEASVGHRPASLFTLARRSSP